MQPLRISKAFRLQATLRDELRHCAYARYLNRLHCLLLVAEGHTCYEAARCFGESARAVERWVHRYEEGGIEALRDLRRGAPGSRKLTSPQIRALALELQGSPRELGYEHGRWSGSLCAHHILRRYGIRLSLRHCQRLLRQGMR
jgi:transposase